jgi:hypothetical protein
MLQFTGMDPGKIRLATRRTYRHRRGGPSFNAWVLMLGIGTALLILFLLNVI